MTPHLFVDISSHGYGHLAQTAPVLNALRPRVPDLRLTVRSGLSRAQIKRRLNGRFTHIPHTSDFGLIMRNALEVDVEASLARYRAFHATWEKRVTEDALLMAQRRPHVVLSNISYLTLAAAARAKIPAWAMGSLNWAEIFEPYGRGTHGAEAMQEQMRQAYGDTECFLRITPGLPMADIPKLKVIDPIARVGRDKRRFLKPALGLSQDTRLILFAMGGLPLTLPNYALPNLPKTKWIASADSGLKGPDVIALESFTMDFIDVIASCDVLFTKTGYGSFVEASACATKVMYVERPDWAEEPVLKEWLHANNVAHGISRAEFDEANYAPALENLLAAPTRAPVTPAGIDQAAALLADRLIHR